MSRRNSEIIRCKAIITYEGEEEKFLLFGIHNQRPRSLCLLGGKMEMDDVDPISAVKREVFEESANTINLDFVDSSGDVDLYGEDGSTYLIFHFIVNGSVYNETFSFSEKRKSFELSRGEREYIPELEMNELRWIPLSNLETALRNKQYGGFYFWQDDLLIMKYILFNQKNKPSLSVRNSIKSIERESKNFYSPSSRRSPSSSRRSPSSRRFSSRSPSPKKKIARTSSSKKK